MPRSRRSRRWTGAAWRRSPWRWPARLSCCCGRREHAGNDRGGGTRHRRRLTAGGGMGFPAARLGRARRAAGVRGRGRGARAAGGTAGAAGGVGGGGGGVPGGGVAGVVRFAVLCLWGSPGPGHGGGRARPAAPAAGTDVEVDNDATLANLERQAVSLAKAGADVIAPSDMMDGRIGAVRAALDGAGKAEVPILSYAVKFASGFYGPFREAAESAPSCGDRRGYQLDPANGREAMREAALDVEEGADLLLVKPALPYLDVLAALRRRWDLPLAAYHVSGEYALLKAAAERGWLDYDPGLMEALIATRRAGADLIVTYGAVDAARLLAGGWRE